MNCKPGDLAVMVRSDAGNEGRIVRCRRIATLQELESYRFRLDVGPAWVIDQLLRCTHGINAPLVFDAYLRPIRNPGEDAKDESLSWLPPVPQVKEEA